jgi:hypothetical protein
MLIRSQRSASASDFVFTMPNIVSRSFEQLALVAWSIFAHN